MPSGDEEEIAARDEVFLCFAALLEPCALLECPTCNPSLTCQGAGMPSAGCLREFDRECTSQIELSIWWRSVLSRRLPLKEQRQRYWSKAFEIGARLSKAVVAAGPSCANVFSMFVRAPENDLNYGADVTLAVQEMEDRFSEAYSRAFDVPLLDHSSTIAAR